MPARRQHFGERDGQCIAFDHRQPRAVEFSQRGQAAPVAFDDGHYRSGIEQRAGESPRSRPDFIGRRAGQVAGHRRNARQQPLIEQEILSERL